jgi:hypothetical protein
MHFDNNDNSDKDASTPTHISNVILPARSYAITSSTNSSPSFTTPAPTRSSSFSVDTLSSLSPLPLPLGFTYGGTMRSLSGSGSVTPSAPSPRAGSSLTFSHTPNNATSGSGAGGGLGSRSSSMDWPQPVIMATNNSISSGGGMTIISPSPSPSSTISSRSGSFDISDDAPSSSLIFPSMLSLRQRTISELSDTSNVSPLSASGSQSPVPASSSSSSSHTPIYRSSPLPTPSESPCVSPPKRGRTVRIPVSTSPTPPATPPQTPQDGNGALPPSSVPPGLSVSSEYMNYSPSPLTPSGSHHAFPGSPFDSLAPSPSSAAQSALASSTSSNGKRGGSNVSAIVQSQSTAVAAAAVLARMTMGQHQHHRHHHGGGSHHHHHHYGVSPSMSSISPIVALSSGFAIGNTIPTSTGGSPDNASPISPISPDDQRSPTTLSPRSLTSSAILSSASSSSMFMDAVTAAATAAGITNTNNLPPLGAVGTNVNIISSNNNNTATSSCGNGRNGSQAAPVAAPLPKFERTPRPTGKHYPFLRRLPPSPIYPGCLIICHLV